MYRTIDAGWANIIDVQLPSVNYDEGLAEEIAQSSGYTVKEIERYIENRGAEILRRVTRPDND